MFILSNWRTKKLLQLCLFKSGHCYWFPNSPQYQWATAADVGFRLTECMSCSCSSMTESSRGHVLTQEVCKTPVSPVLAGAQYAVSNRQLKLHWRFASIWLWSKTILVWDFNALSICVCWNMMKWKVRSRDSRSAHRYWTWGSWIPHVTPPHAHSFCQLISVLDFKPGMLRIY